MITAYFRQIDGDAYGLAVAPNWKSLFWKIDEHLDPFSVEIFRMKDNYTSLCWDIDGENRRKVSAMLRDESVELDEVDHPLVPPAKDGGFIEGSESVPLDWHPEDEDKWYRPDWRAMSWYRGNALIEDALAWDTAPIDQESNSEV